MILVLGVRIQKKEEARHRGIPLHVAIGVKTSFGSRQRKRSTGEGQEAKEEEIGKDCETQVGGKRGVASRSRHSLGSS